MNSYVIPSGGPDQGEGEIANLAFFPALSAADFKTRLRVPPSIDHAHIVAELKRAVLQVNGELRQWRLDHEAAGTMSLTNIEQDTYGETPELVTLYEAAIYHTAKAYLLEKHRDMDLTNEGADKAEFAEAAAADSYRHARQSIGALIGRRTTIVELI